MDALTLGLVHMGSQANMLASPNMEAKSQLWSLKGPLKYVIVIDS